MELYPKMRTDCSSPATSFLHCSLAVPTLLLPHGTKGGGPHPRLVAGGSKQGTAILAVTSCSCLMAPMAVALILGWCLVAASRAQQLPRPSLSLHASQGVSMGDNVTLRCHLPRMAAWVQLWHNGTLRFNKEKDKEQDTAEFSFAVTNLEDAGTYQCRYQVSEPLWTSNQSDPVELVLTGAKGRSHGNLVVAVLRGCAAVLVFSLGLYFVLDARSLWTWRDESAGVTPEMHKSVQFQGLSMDNEDLTYAEMPAAIPCSQPPTYPTAPQSPVIYTTDMTLTGWCCQIPSVWKGAEVTSQLSRRKKFLTQAGKHLPSLAEIFDDTGCNVLEPPGVSEKSVPIELVVTDHRYPPPNISISHEKIVEVGTNVTIQCCNQGYGGIIFLHKDGHSAPLQHQDPHGGGTATFTLFGVTPADSGTYRCSYHPKASLFVSTPLGDSVTLEVTPTPAPPGAELVSRGNLVVAVVRGCAAVLIFALGIFFVIDARSLWIRRDESLGGEGI